MKKRVYVDSSVISYLTARPSKIEEKRERQQITRRWWEERHRWDLFLSSAVMDEIEEGDVTAATRRMAIAIHLTQLPEEPQLYEVAEELVSTGAVPIIALADATHLAWAALNKMDYLLTWNQKHLNNDATRKKIKDTLEKKGLRNVEVLSPQALLEKIS